MIIFHVGRSPSIKAKLREELSTLPGPEQPNLQQLEQLPYLTGVVKEGLRMGIGGPGKLGRVSPDRTIIYSESNITKDVKESTPTNRVTPREWAIPPGTEITFTTMHIHLNDRYFHDAMTFDPERWVLCTVEERQELEKHLVTFARGTRICLGHK